MKTTKAWVAIVGCTASATITVFGADTIAGKVAAVLVLACTAFGVYQLPNERDAPAATAAGSEGK